MTQKPHFQALDALRGVAALAVMVFHFRLLVFPNRHGDIGFASGYLAVDLFFLLSGFVIAYAYDAKLAAGMTFCEFARLRAIRLLPLIWVGVAIGAAVLTAAGMPVLRVVEETAPNILALPSPPIKGIPMFPADGPEWSLFFEMVANLAFALLFPWLTTRRLIVVCGAFGVALLAFAVLYSKLQDGYTFSRAHVGLARVGFSFCLGVILCRTRDGWIPRVPRLSIWVVLALVVLSLWAPVHGHRRAVYDVGFVFVASPLLLMLCVAAAPDPQSTRASWIAIQLGALSYPLYAFHQPARDAVTMLSQRVHVSGPAMSFAAMLVFVPLSLALFYFYDRPVRALLMQLTSGASERPAPRKSEKPERPGR